MRKLEVNVTTGEVIERDLTEEEISAIHAENAENVEIPVVPRSITRKQCATELFIRGIITSEEAIAMASVSTPPQIVENVLSAIEEPDQTLARISFTSDNYDRDNPLLNAVIKSVNEEFDDKYINDFFIEANKK